MTYPHVGPFDLSGILGRIDLAIANVGTQGDTWIATLGALAGELQNNGLVQAAAYVRNTLQDGIASVGVEYRCNVDFTASRIRGGLAALKAALQSLGGDAVPPPAAAQPLVCNGVPSKIAWPEAPQSVALRGYDFRHGEMTAVVVDGAGGEADVSAALAVVSSYDLQLNLSSSGAGFPRSCAKVSVRWRGVVVSEIPCLVDCPPAPPPIVVPGDRRAVLDETHRCVDSVLTGCRFDRFAGNVCPNGYARDQFEIVRVAGQGASNCGEGDVDTPNARTSHWQSSNPQDCSIHEHIGLTGGFQNFATCRFVVWAVRPPRVIPQPAPTVGWCR